MKTLAGLLRKTFLRWWDDGGPHMGASLSFYTAFSLAPLLLLSISMASLFFGQEDAQWKIIDELRSTMGAQAARIVQGLLQSGRDPSSAGSATLFGFLMLLLGASVVMGDLKYTLNRIWRAQRPMGFFAFIKNKLLSVGMVLAIGFLLLVSLLVSVLLAALGRSVEHVLPLPEWLIQILNLFVSLGFISALFAAVFKFLPDARIRWRDVIPGAILTALLFKMGEMFLGLYLGKGALWTSVYGAAGSVFAMLLWLYYSAQILYFGAEFTKIYADEIRPRVD